MSANNPKENNGLPSEVAQLQKEARILDLCDLAKRTTEKLAAAEIEIGETKKKLNDFVGARESFNKKAAHAAKVLAGCGAIGDDKVDEFINKVAEDPSGVWDFIEKMAENFSAPTLGEVSGFAASRSVDPWLKLLGGGCRGAGYVD